MTDETLSVVVGLLGALLWVVAVVAIVVIGCRRL